MSPSSVPIRLYSSQISSAAAVLARAFQDDPLAAHFYPNAATRSEGMARTAQCVLRYGMLHGEVHVTSPALEGVAVWLPPSRMAPSTWDMLRAGVFFLPFTVGMQFFSRFRLYVDHVAKMRRQSIHVPYWYLQMLGVDPSHRGGGYGSILLRTMLARLDQERMPCCLDTENESNVAMYEHFGFRVLASEMIPGSQDRCWLMMREAGAKAAKPEEAAEQRSR